MRPLESGTPRRRPASDMPLITGLRFLPSGAKVSLVNISPTGLLAESATRLLVGSAVQVVFEGGFSPASAPGRVVRCEVAVMGRDGLLRYHLAIKYDSPIALDDEVEEPAPAPVPQDARNRW